MRRLGAILLTVLPAMAAAQEFFTLKGHGGPIMGIAVSAQDQVATASFDNAVGLWSDRTPQWLDGHAAAVNTVLFTGDGLVSGSDDFSVRRWPTGEVIGRHKGKVMGLAAAPELIASASWDGSIGLWPLDGSPPKMLTGHDAGVNDVAFTAGFSQLYSAGIDGTLRLWDVASGQEMQQVLRHGFGINDLVLNHAEGWLAYGAVDGVTRVIDMASGDTIADFTLGHRPVLALALSPDGREFAVGDGEGYIMLVDTTEWRIAQDFRATLRGPVWALAYSADGANIHAGGLDHAMYSWPRAALDEHGQMATTTASYQKDPAEMSNGERQFARKCSICHALTPGSARRAGPSLHGLFGRRAGTVGDYSYSGTLVGSSIIWNEDSIDALFDLGPDHFIPGSKMPMQRITNPDDRDDLIAYLRQATK